MIIDREQGELRITVNGDEMVYAPDVAPRTVAELIERLGLRGTPVAVERNGDVVPRTDHGSVRLEAGDSIEIVHFVGGG